MFKFCYSQRFNSLSIHPPNVGLKHKYINAYPVSSVIRNCINVQYSSVWVYDYFPIGIRFDQKWRPVKLDCCIIFLITTNYITFFQSIGHNMIEINLLCIYNIYYEMLVIKNSSIEYVP